MNSSSSSTVQNSISKYLGNEQESVDKQNQMKKEM